MKNFSVSIDVDAMDGNGMSWDAAVDVDLTVDLSNDDARTLTKEIAGAVGDFLRQRFKDNGHITVCT